MTGSIRQPLTVVTVPAREVVTMFDLKLHSNDPDLEVGQRVELQLDPDLFDGRRVVVVKHYSIMSSTFNSKVARVSVTLG